MEVAGPSTPCRAISVCSSASRSERSDNRMHHHERGMDLERLPGGEDTHKRPSFQSRGLEWKWPMEESLSDKRQNAAEASRMAHPGDLHTSAFTLIELLIVVAIIGILAAIAVPNFLNAQIRSKIAQVESEMRSLDTALESYRLDRDIYPPWKNENGSNRNEPGFSEKLRPLTTPVAYIQSVPKDPFSPDIVDLDNHDTTHPSYDTYNYVDAWATVHYPVYDPNSTLGSSFRCSEWSLVSAGPDDILSFGAVPSFQTSNGLRSNGDLVRVGPRAEFECDASLVGR